MRLSDLVKMSYESVKNYAKDGKLTRAELREFVLAIAMLNGFETDKVLASRIYYLDEDKRAAFVVLRSYIPKYLDNKASDIEKIPIWVTEALRHYYGNTKSNVKKEPYNPDAVCVSFFDTKKFRVYKKRLEYGHKRKWRLREKNMRYLWTPLPLAYWMHEISDPASKALDFELFYAVSEAWDVQENMRALSSYLTDICKIENKYLPQKSLFKLYLDDANYEKLEVLCRAEARKLKQKLYYGTYIELEKSETIDIDTKGLDYGKKTREQVRAYVSGRKNQKDKSPA